MTGTKLPEETVVLAGGCFWCTEAVFSEVRGVTEVIPGYAGGNLPSPTYEDVCTGRTGHAEVVRVRFHPDEIPLADVLRIFFATHDPTTRDRQGNDVCTQYRSAVFYADDDQRRTAAEVMEELRREQVYPRPLVTELAPLSAFYPAEEYHHQYFARNPGQGYCRAVIAPKVDKFRHRYVHYLKADPPPSTSR